MADSSTEANHLREVVGRIIRRLGSLLVNSSTRITLALAVVAGLSWLAFTQDPRPDPRREPGISQPAWWLNPLEFNAIMRLPEISGTLTDVFALKGTDKVWVVGGGGFILHSADGGLNWHQQTMPAVARPTVQQQLERFMINRNQL